ncbi:FMN-binding negative transcriptional regulator [Paraburkholderia caledonica]|uniref:FMN-binding negative transcriptional regulator n=1 Tax=Paraburkholderia caledonica TaxID=134536 RepID=UPI003CC60E0D
MRQAIAPRLAMRIFSNMGGTRIQRRAVPPWEFAAAVVHGRSRISDLPDSVVRECKSCSVRSEPARGSRSNCERASVPYQQLRGRRVVGIARVVQLRAV